MITTKVSGLIIPIDYQGNVVVSTDITHSLIDALNYGKVQVKFAKLDPRAIIPSYAKPGDNGLDLTAISYEHVIKRDVTEKRRFIEYEYHNYEFGLSVEIPPGYVGLIFPRSSISNKDLMLTNSVGVIDSSYRGPLSARFKTMSDDSSIYNVGDRVAQLVILPCPQISIVEVTPEALSLTERGSGGFGSSGV